MSDYPRPNNFPYDEVFYDDEEVSLMCGKYKSSNTYSVGMRWNVGESELGYPNIFGKSMWMVVPDKIAVLVLRGLLDDGEQQDYFIRKPLAEKYLAIIEQQL